MNLFELVAKLTLDSSEYDRALMAAKGTTAKAGDSMVAGFLAGYIKTKDYSYALKLGIAAGAATAAAPGLASGEEIERIMES